MGFWGLLGVIGLLLPGPAAQPPPAQPVDIFWGSTDGASACEPTELTVYLDNKDAPARSAVLGFDHFGDSGQEHGPVEFRTPSGQWQELPAHSEGPRYITPATQLPANGDTAFTFRTQFTGGLDRSAGRVRVTVISPDQGLNRSEMELLLTAPVVRIDRPVRERISRSEPVEFGVHVSNRAHADCPGFLRIANGQVLDKLTSGRGMTVEVAAAGGPWRRVQVGGSTHSWDATLDDHPVPAGTERDYRVRFSSAEQTGKLDLDLEQWGPGGALAKDSVTVEVLDAPPPLLPDFPWGRFGVGVALGAGLAALGLLGFRLGRRRRVRS